MLSIQLPRKRKIVELETDNNMNFFYFNLFHQTILNSSSLPDAAQTMGISSIDLEDFLAKINISYIELKILNETQLGLILGDQYYEVLASFSPCNLTGYVIQAIQNEIKDSAYSKDVYTSKILSHYLDLYLHQFLYGDVPLTFNILHDLNFQMGLVKQINNVTTYCSIAKLHSLIFENESISFSEAANYFNTSQRQFKLMLASKQFQGDSLTFNKLKNISKEEALNIWGENYYQPLTKLHNEIIDGITFKKLHYIIQTSKSLADAALKLGINHTERFIRYLKKLNLLHFELFFLDVSEIQKILGDKYDQKIIDYFQFDLIAATISKILLLLKSEDPSKKLTKAIKNYLSNFTYNGQPLTVSLMLDVNFSVCAVEKIKEKSQTIYSEISGNDIPANENLSVDTTNNVILKLPRKINQNLCPSIEDLLILISGDKAISLTRTAEFFQIDKQTLKKRLARNLYHGVPLTFNQLKKITPEDAKIAFGSSYSQPLGRQERNSKRLNQLCFEELYLIIHSSSSFADAAAKLNSDRPTLARFLEKVNLFYFELLLLNTNEIEEIIGNQYYQEISSDFKFDFSINILRKLFNIKQSKLQFDSEMLARVPEFERYLRDYLSNFIYKEQQFTIDMMIDPTFDCSIVRNKVSNPLSTLNFNNDIVDHATIVLNSEPLDTPYGIFLTNLLPHDSTLPNATQTESHTIMTAEEEALFNLNFLDECGNITTELEDKTPNDNISTMVSPIALSSSDSTPLYIYNESKCVSEEEPIYGKIKSTVTAFLQSSNEEKISEISKHILNYLTSVKTSEINKKIAELSSLGVKCTTVAPTTVQNIIPEVMPEPFSSTPSMNFGQDPTQTIQKEFTQDNASITQFSIFSTNRIISDPKNKTDTSKLNPIDFQPEF